MLITQPTCLSGFLACCFAKVDCSDGSDESFCNYGQAPRYTGCWSYEQTGNGATTTGSGGKKTGKKIGGPRKSGNDVTFRLVDCSSCLCAADEARCMNDDAFVRSCDVCVTQPDLIDDGSNQCLFGIGMAIVSRFR